MQGRRRKGYGERTEAKTSADADEEEGFLLSRAAKELRGSGGAPARSGLRTQQRREGV